jgi:hypothetical protein
LVDLLDAQWSPAGTTDAIVQQAGEHGRRVRLIGPTCEVNHLLWIGLVVVEFRAISAVRTPFRVAEAVRPQAVSVAKPRQGRASRSGRWVAQDGSQAGPDSRSRDHLQYVLRRCFICSVALSRISRTGRDWRCDWRDGLVGKLLRLIDWKAKWHPRGSAKLHNSEKQASFVHSCHADRKTRCGV